MRSSVEPTVAVLKTGETAVIRPIQPEDEALLVAFHEELSDRTVYQRYFHMMKLEHRTAHARLAQVCAADQSREVVLVAEVRDPPGARAIIGVCRLTDVAGTEDAEFAIIVTDRYQGVGCGSALMRRLIEVARARPRARLAADILIGNSDMRRLCQRVGIAVVSTEDPQIVRAELALSTAGASDDQNARNTANDRSATR